MESQEGQPYQIQQVTSTVPDDNTSPADVPRDIQQTSYGHKKVDLTVGLIVAHVLLTAFAIIDIYFKELGVTIGYTVARVAVYIPTLLEMAFKVGDCTRILLTISFPLFMFGSTAWIHLSGYELVQRSVLLCADILIFIVLMVIPVHSLHYV